MGGKEKNYQGELIIFLGFELNLYFVCLKKYKLLF